MRPYEPRDATVLAGIYRDAVRRLGGRDYSPEQVDAWLSLAPSAGRLDALGRDGRVRLVAAGTADRPAAFIDLEASGHIDFLYASPAAAGTGAVSALYDALEREARRRRIVRLYAEASEAARRFFLKKGFAVTARRDFEVAGVPIHNYAVEKLLVSAEAAVAEVAGR